MRGRGRSLPASSSNCWNWRKPSVSDISQRKSVMRFEENKIGTILVAKVLANRIAADVAPQFKAHIAG